MADYCTLAELKAYGALNQSADGVISSGRDDVLLAAMITGYSALIEETCGWKGFVSAADTLHFNGRPYVQVDKDGRLWVQTRYPTLQSVTRLSWKTRARDPFKDVDTTDLTLNTIGPSEIPNNFSWAVFVDSADFMQYRDCRLWVEVVLVGGYVSLPPALHELAMELIWWGYKQREAIPMSVVAFPMMENVVKPVYWPPYVRDKLIAWSRSWF